MREAVMMLKVQVAAPFIAAGLWAATIPTLIGIGAGQVVGISTNIALDAAGVNNEVARELAQDAAGFGAGLAMSRFASGLRRVPSVSTEESADLNVRSGQGQAQGCAVTGCDPTGFCFVAGAQVKTSEGYALIESLVIGDRVLTDEECLGTEVDESSWAAITLEMANPDGSDDVLELHVLRPLMWLAERDAGEGTLIEINLEEMKLRGLARVIAVDYVPRLTDGPGCLVLSTVTHLNGHVLELRFAESETLLEPTSEHHLLSYDAQDWIAAGDLRPGDRLTTSNGYVTIASVDSKPGVYRVFNIEVETRHAYYVSVLDIFSHNTGDCPFANSPVVGGGAAIENISKGEATRIQNAATRIGRKISLVGSRAGGTAGPDSDWDYVIEGANSKQRNSVSRSLPGAKDVGEGIPSDVDLQPGPVRPKEPYITLSPRKM